MNTTLLERLKAFQIPPSLDLTPGHTVVARLEGVDFAKILSSAGFGFEQPVDLSFSKMMTKTAARMLGDDTCGRIAFPEQTEISVLLSSAAVEQRWSEVSELRGYLAAVATAKMSLMLDAEAVFRCSLYSFAQADLAKAYFLWRQQTGAEAARDHYCSHVLAQQGQTAAVAQALLEDLSPVEKEELLRQHGIEYSTLPEWQRLGAAVFLSDNGLRVTVQTSLPQDAELGPFLQPFLG